jgi:quercetin dioxygenase-like cupin family protein
MINCMDRDYCKKILVQLPGQVHPEHYHKEKEESFQLLHGDLELILEDSKKSMKPGDILLVKPGQKHSFSTKGGAVIEEVSTKYSKGGSVYTHPEIFSGDPDSRKTYLGKL